MHDIIMATKCSNVAAITAQYTYYKVANNKKLIHHICYHVKRTNVFRKED